MREYSIRREKLDPIPPTVQPERIPPRAPIRGREFVVRPWGYAQDVRVKPNEIIGVKSDADKKTAHVAEKATENAFLAAQRAEKSAHFEQNSQNAAKEPSIKMKDEAAEKRAQKLEDELGALFMAGEFDVLTPDGKIIPTSATSKVQAQYLVDTGKYRNKELLRCGIVYNKGEGENAIISINEQVGGDRILRAGREFPVAVRASGSGFSRVIASGITNVRAISTAQRIVTKSA